jgi:hypothetical protein
LNQPLTSISKVSTQYTDGLTGGFVVHPSNAAGQQPKNFPTWDGEIMVQMADLYHNFSQVLGAAYLSVRTLLWLECSIRHLKYSRPGAPSLTVLMAILEMSLCPMPAYVPSLNLSKPQSLS